MKNYLLIGAFSVALFSCGTKSTTENNGENVDSTSVQEPVGKVYFVSPADMDTVLSPLTIQMGVEGMEVEPAGAVNPGKGHHHLIIDGSFIEKGTVVPADETHIHYGKGQTEVQLDLAPGSHTLTMQFADGVHTSFGEPWSSTITVFVKDSTNLQ